MSNQIERIETHHLRYDFTAEELRDFSRTMARESQDLDAAEAQKKVATAQFAEEIARHKSIVAQMARHINNGYEMRLLPCAVLLDTPVRSTAMVVRKDTGDIVKERPMNDQELKEAAQAKLPLEPEKPARKAAKAGK